MNKCFTYLMIALLLLTLFTKDQIDLSPPPRKWHKRSRSLLIFVVVLSNRKTLSKVKLVCNQIGLQLNICIDHNGRIYDCACLLSEDCIAMSVCWGHGLVY